MSQVKTDLICEIIRISQTNLLGKKEANGACTGENHERLVLKWVKDNAKNYREYYRDQLMERSCTELADLLKALNESGSDLSQLLSTSPAFVEKF